MSVNGSGMVLCMYSGMCTVKSSNQIPMHRYRYGSAVKAKPLLWGPTGDVNLRTRRTSHPQNQTQQNLPGHEGCPIVSPLSHANAAEAETAGKWNKCEKEKLYPFLSGIWFVRLECGLRGRKWVPSVPTLIALHPTHSPFTAECSCKTAFSYRQYFPQLFVIWSRNGYRFLFCILRLCDFQAFSWANPPSHSLWRQSGWKAGE